MAAGVLANTDTDPDAYKGTFAWQSKMTSRVDNLTKSFLSHITQSTTIPLAAFHNATLPECMNGLGFYAPSRSA
eukprot:15330660-Ditylum_brightwellii.AAC.1